MSAQWPAFRSSTSAPKPSRRCRTRSRAPTNSFAKALPPHSRAFRPSSSTIWKHPETMDQQESGVARGGVSRQFFEVSIRVCCLQNAQYEWSIDFANHTVSHEQQRVNCGYGFRPSSLLYPANTNSFLAIWLPALILFL